MRPSFVRAHVVALVLLVACGKATQDPPAPSNTSRGRVDAVSRNDIETDRFEGVLSNHHFTITIARGQLAGSDRTSYTWNVDGGRLVVSDSGSISEETRYLVERSPRTIVRGSDGLWVVTEVVTTAGGRVFTCLHQQPIAKDGSPEAKQAAARGVAACGSLKVD